MTDPWLRRIERVHVFGIVMLVGLMGSVALMQFWPEAFWTRWVPVVESVPIDHGYHLDDVRHWTEVRSVVPTRQARIGQLRQELSTQTSRLHDWVIEASTDANARTKRLRKVAESFHERATRFGLDVELIRIEKSEPRSADEVQDLNVELQWCPMTLRMEGTYVQACRFLHHVAEHLPARCHRLAWTRVATISDRDARHTNVQPESRFRLELEIAIAVRIDGPAVEKESIQDESVDRNTA